MVLVLLSRRLNKVSVEKVVRVGVKKEAGYLYFVDKDGDVSRTKAMRGRRID